MKRYIFIPYQIKREMAYYILPKPLLQKSSSPNTHFEKLLVFGRSRKDTTPQQAHIQANCGKERGSE
jgi:hypothetical protein